MKKTHIERKIIDGDLLGFMADMNQLGYPHEKIMAARMYWNELPRVSPPNKEEG